MHSLLLKWYVHSKLCKLSYSDYSFKSFKKVSHNCHKVEFKNMNHCLVVRGTKDLNDYKMDISLNKIYDNDIGMHLHNGFQKHAKTLVDTLLKNKDLEYQTKYDFTGHSAGACISLISALYLKNEGYQISNVTSFGQPPFTDKDGAILVDNTLNNYLRFVIEDDIVCNFHEYYPFSELKYKHCGKMIQFSKISKNPIANHKIDTYITRLKQLIDD